jgi:hypothetical protein
LLLVNEIPENRFFFRLVFLGLPLLQFWLVGSQVASLGAKIGMWSLLAVLCIPFFLWEKKDGDANLNVMSGVIIGSIGGAIVGAIGGETSMAIVAIVGMLIGMVIVGAIVGAIVHAINGGDAILGAIIGAIVGAMFVAILGAIGVGHGATGMAIVGAIGMAIVGAIGMAIVGEIVVAIRNLFGGDDCAGAGMGAFGGAIVGAILGAAFGLDGSCLGASLGAILIDAIGSSPIGMAIVGAIGMSIGGGAVVAAIEALLSMANIPACTRTRFHACRFWVATSQSVLLIALVLPISPLKEAALDILGVAAMHISSYDTEDPVEVGEQTCYVVDTRNEGIAPCTSVEMKSKIPEEMEFLEAEGTVAFKYDLLNRMVVFDSVPVLPPGDKLTYKVRCKAIQEGSAKHSAILKYKEFETEITDEEGTTVCLKRK